MIQKTKITNSFNEERMLKWAGHAGIAVGPLESIILEGAYPSACRDKKAREIFEYEYNKGMFKAVLITDMSVSRRKQPEHIKENIEDVIENQKVQVTPLTP